MKIELKKMWLVVRNKKGEPEILNGEPISASPHELTICDVEDESREPCDASYCRDFCQCPDCGRAFKDFGEVNIKHGVLVFRVPCEQVVYDAVRDEALKIVARDYPDAQITRCAGLQQQIVDAAMLVEAEDLGAFDDDDEPDEEDLP